MLLTSIHSAAICPSRFFADQRPSRSPPASALRCRHFVWPQNGTKWHGTEWNENGKLVFHYYCAFYSGYRIGKMLKYVYYAPSLFQAGQSKYFTFGSPQTFCGWPSSSFHCDFHSRGKYLNVREGLARKSGRNTSQYKYLQEFCKKRKVHTCAHFLF